MRYLMIIKAAVTREYNKTLIVEEIEIVPIKEK
jgi:hypothetical protein